MTNISRCRSWPQLLDLIRSVVRHRLPEVDWDDAVQATALAILKTTQRHKPQDWNKYCSGVARIVCNHRLRQRYRHRAVFSLPDENFAEFAAPPSTWGKEEEDVVSSRDELRAVLVPLLAHRLGFTERADRRRRVLLTKLCSDGSEALTISSLAHDLGCDRVQLRRDLRMIANLARKFNGTCPSPPT